MQIGKYRIGRYHAIIKKFYEDGSTDYEVYFASQEDLQYSISAIERCIGKLVGFATDNPRVLINYEVIRGKEAIRRELETEK